MSTRNDYLERLAEAQLDGTPLPEPSNDREAEILAEFEETNALFSEATDMQLDEGWRDDVWARIDGTASPDTGEERSSVRGRSGAETNGDDSAENVIDARDKFRVWPVLAGLAVAAAALLAIYLPFAGTLDSRRAPETPPGEAGEMAHAPEAASQAEAPDEVVSSEAQPAEEEEAGEIALATDAPAGAVGTKAADSSAELRELPDTAGVGAGGGGFATPRDEADETAADDREARNFDLLKSDEDADRGRMDPSEGLGSTATGAESSARPENEPARSKRSRRRGSGAGRGWDGDGDIGLLGGDDMNRMKDEKRGGWGRRERRQRLTAGEIDDNAKFDEFQRFLAKRDRPHLESADVSERVFVRVLDANNLPLPNATVDFKVGNQSVFTGKTYADGWVLFHPETVPAAANAESLELRISQGEASHTYRVTPGAKERWQVRLPVERDLQSRPKLDLVFLLDTTASMDDQLETLQTTIIDVADDVSRLPGNPRVRFGLVLYRDRSDDYVSRVFDFQPNVRQFQQTLAQQRAAGGGDTPERLDEGLHRTVHELQWDPDAVRLVFLVGDAPPHPRIENEFSYIEDSLEASQRAIRVHTVATSGLKDDGEYVFRQIAQLTRGRFVFLTEGPSGTSTPHDVKPGSFQPETLDSLVVRLVREELDALRPTTQTATPHGR